MKRKLLTTAMRLARKKAHAKKYNQIYKSLSKYNIRSSKTKQKDLTRQQKATTHSGIEVKTQRGTHYGIRGLTHKMHPKGAGAVIRRMPYVGSRETWTAEMHRMYGGIHMSQTREGTKKSVQILAKNYKKRFKKTKAKRGKFFKKLGRVALAGAALYGASRLGAPKTLSGETVKTIPVTAKYIGFPEIETPESYEWEFPTTLNDGGEVVIGKNVDKDLL